ncbi:MAG: DUF763 domain-containing protein [Nitrososphaerota archaeon]
MYRSGLRDLEIHYVSNPRWYFSRAEKILIPIVESYIELYGIKKFLRGLASPIFFDALTVASHLDEIEGASTTLVTIVLKQVLIPDTGLAEVRDKRTEGYRVPVELEKVGKIFGFSEKKMEYLKYVSRIVAKVDNVAIQDGFELYFHLMVLSSDGEWTIIQQGIKSLENLVRRYHWTSINIKNFIEEPHTGIVAMRKEEHVIDMTSRRSRESRESIVQLVTKDTSKLKGFYRYSQSKGQLTLLDQEFGDNVRFEIPKINWSNIESLIKQQPKDFEELLLHRGVGIKTMRFLVFASIEVYHVKPSFEDPAIILKELYKPQNMHEDRWIYEMMDAVRESSLEMFMKKTCLNRLYNFFFTQES